MGCLSRRNSQLASTLLQADNNINTVYLRALGRGWQTSNFEIFRADIKQPAFLFIVEMKMVGGIGIKKAAVAFNGHFAQQSRRRELIERIIDRGHRHQHFCSTGFPVQIFRRHVPVAAGKQDFCQRQALPGGPQTHGAQFLRNHARCIHFQHR